MYQKYQTEALILGERESGEADKVFSLFTRDFGLIRARAIGVRAEKSKMRYSLQHFSHAHAGLVRGKASWRLAGASVARHAGTDRQAVAAFARISALVLRLVQGEEKNEYLFDALAEAHGALMRSHCEAWATIELVCVARILFALGYLSAESVSATLFTHTAYAERELAEAQSQYDRLLSSINKAIAETQL